MASLGRDQGSHSPMTFGEWLNIMRPQFPKLTAGNCRPTSPADENYNCIAWAANDKEFWWWPDRMGQAHWPAEVPREETIEAFVLAYGTLGYTVRTDASSEPGKHKVAIYADRDGKPTHASRQTSDGWWASKLGKSIDVEHEFSALDGPAYGSVVVVLARVVQ